MGDMHRDDIPETKSNTRETGQPLAPWSLEAASLLASIACVTAILVLLSTQDNKPIPNWHGITLNSAVSVLSDLVHAALIYPISEAIGQLKWMWYWNQKRPKPLCDFEAYNCATRGPFGCLWFLFKPRLWHLSSVGALLTVVALAMQFFLQLMPIYEPGAVKIDDNATIGRSINYTDWRPDPVGGATLRINTSAVLNNAIFGFADVEPDVTTTCATGNCTWPSHQSLGICTACADVQARINKTTQAPCAKNWNPNRILPMCTSAWHYSSLNYIPDYHFSISNLMLPVVWTAISDYEIVNFVFAYWKPDQTKKDFVQRPQVFECILYYCVRTYNTSIINGKLEETVTDIWPPAIEDAKKLDWPSPTAADTKGGPGKANKNVEFQPKNSSTRYFVPRGTTQALSSWLSNQIGIYIAIAWDSQGYGDLDTQVFHIVQANHGPLALMNSLANRLTTHMRNQGPGTTAGETYTMKTFVRVRWLWAILPLTLLVLALVFLVLTAILSASRSIPTWKNSSLPGFVYQLDEQWSKDIASDGPYLAGLEKKAKDCKVAMASGGPMWKLDGYAQETKTPKDSGWAFRRPKPEANTKG